MRLVIAAAALASAAPIFAIPPPAPPADPERLALAKEIWRSQALMPHMAVGDLVFNVAHQIATAEYPKSERRRRAYAEQLRPILTRVVTERFDSLSDRALPCMADSLARGLTVAELEGVLAFFRSEPGKAFWPWFLSGARNWQLCYYHPLSQFAGSEIQSLGR